MGLNYKILKSAKQASICRYAGCDLDIQIDAQNSSAVIFRASPIAAAEYAIAQFESGAELPARELLNVHDSLHREIKLFMSQWRQIGSDKGKKQ